MMFPETMGKRVSKSFLNLYFGLSAVSQRLEKIDYAILNRYRRKFDTRPRGLPIFTSGLLSSLDSVVTRCSFYFSDASEFVERHTDTSVSSNAWKEAYLAGNELRCLYCSLDAPVHACAECDVSIVRELCWKNEGQCDACKKVQK